MENPNGIGRKTGKVDEAGKGTMVYTAKVMFHGVEYLDRIKMSETGVVSHTAEPVEEKEADVPQTGDESRIVLWLGIMLAAGAVLSGTIVYNRQKRNYRK